jgi:hypothetical protein
MLRQSIVLSLSLILVSCNGSGGGGSSEVSSGGMTAAQRLTLFEQNYLSAAESLEDQSIFRYNPCRDDLNWVSTGANSGTIEISGYTFTTNNVVDIQRTGVCDVEVTPHNPFSAAGVTVNFASSGSKLLLSTDYTAMFLVQGGGLNLYDPSNVSRPELLQTELVASANFIVPEENSLIPYHNTVRARVDRNDVKFSTSLAIFEVDRTYNSASITHYNDVAGSIPMTKINGAGFDSGVHNPQLSDLEVDAINAGMWNGARGTMGLIIFDRILDSNERKLLKCYGLYLSTKSGDMSLWNSLSSSVCNL